MPGGLCTQSIHARYDCIENPFASTVPGIYRPTCWCARWELPVRQFTDRAGRDTAHRRIGICQTRKKAARVADVAPTISKPWRLLKAKAAAETEADAARIIDERRI